MKIHDFLKLSREIKNSSAKPYDIQKDPGYQMLQRIKYGKLR